MRGRPCNLLGPKWGKTGTIKIGVWSADTFCRGSERADPFPRSVLEPPDTGFAASAWPPRAEGGEWGKVGGNWYDKNRGLPTLFAEDPKAANRVRRAALGPPDTSFRAPSTDF